MDAFGASVSRGAALRSVPFVSALRISAVFGAFAAVTPALGWALGAAFIGVISAVDHWIAFILLAALGAKMIRDALGRDDPAPVAAGIRLAVVAASALATSIDTGIFGVALPSLQVGLPEASATIGCVTFAAAFAGLKIGGVTGAVAGRRAEIAGGLLLVALGIKILLDHTVLSGQVA